MASYTNNGIYYNDSLNTIIGNAITSLDNIYTAINERIGQDVLGTSVYGTTVAQYPTLIRTYLFSIHGVHLEGELVSSFNGGSSVLNNYMNAHQVASTVNVSNPVVYNNAKLVVTSKLPGLGVYDNKYNIITELNTAPLSIVGELSASTWADQIDAGTWKHTVPDGTIYSDITLKKAAINFAIGTITPNGLTNTLTTTAFDAGALEITNVAPNSEIINNYHAITLTTKSSVTGSFSATATASGTQQLGYINNTSQVTVQPSTRTLGEESGQLAVTGTKTDTIYVKKGGLTLGNPSGGEVSVSDPSSISVEAENKVSGKQYYELTANAADISFPEAAVEEGYIIGNNTLGITAQGGSKSVFVLQGSTEDVTLARSVEVKTNSKNVIIDSNAGNNDYVISLGLDGAETETGTINPGYNFDSSYTARLNITPFSLRLPKASVTNTIPNALSLSRTGGTISSDKFDTSGTDQSAYSLTLKIEGEVTTSRTEGYLQDAISPTSINKNNQIWISKGSVGVTPTLSITPVFNDEGTNNDGGNLLDPTTLFKTATTGFTGDYYTLTLGSNRSVTEGYIKAADVSPIAGTTYYLPKATLQWVENGVGGEDYLQVVTGGYLPSGILTDISNISASDIDGADATVTLSTLGTNILKTTASNGAYQIDLARGTTDAGYLSANKGTISLAHSYYIDRGAATVTLTTAAPTFDTSTLALNTDHYEMTISSSASVATTSQTNGYLDSAAQITLNTDADSNSAVLSLDQAETSISGAALGTNALSGGLAFTGFGFAPGETNYAITFDLGELNKSVSASISSAGYGDVGTGSSSATLSGTGIKYLKAGSAEITSASAALNVSSNFNTNQQGDYTVTANIAPGGVHLVGSINEGYVSTGGFTGNALTLSDNTLSIAHGSVSMITASSASLTTGANSSVDVQASLAGLNLTNSASAVEGVDYLILKANSTGTATSSVTEGYVKSGDVTPNNSNNTSHTDYYLRRYNVRTVEETVSNETVTYYDPTYDTNGITDDTLVLTKDSYMSHDTKIRLSPNAVGSNVQADLERLAYRLNGTLLS